MSSIFFQYSNSRYAGSDLQLLTPFWRICDTTYTRRPYSRLRLCDMCDLHTVHTRGIQWAGRCSKPGEAGDSAVFREDKGARAHRHCLHCRSPGVIKRTRAQDVAIQAVSPLLRPSISSACSVSLERLPATLEPSKRLKRPGKPMPSSGATLRTSIFNCARRLPAKTHETLQLEPRRHHPPASQRRATSLATAVHGMRLWMLVV